MEILAEVVRSGFVESRHRGVAVAVDPTGDVVWSLGDPSTAIFPRSTNKPFQAMGMLRAGLALEGRLLAIASASHHGEAFHLEAVREVLAGAGLDESALQAPPSYPLDGHVHAELLRAGGQRASILMDCSGKHAAMLATCVLNGWPIDSYLDPEHPLQVRITETFVELTGGLPAAVGTDGCGAPLLGTSVAHLAHGFGRIARGDDPLSRRLVDAMVAHPEYLSGSRSLEKALMQAIPGAIVKSGAEAVYAVGLPDGSAFALKIEDGAERALHVVMQRAMELAGHDLAGLGEHPVVLGGGRPVGEIRPSF